MATAKSASKKRSAPVADDPPPKKKRVVKNPGRGSRAPNKKPEERLIDWGNNSTYTPEIGEHICQVVANGMMLKEACRRLNIHLNRIYDWCDAFPDFDVALRRARAIGVESMLEEGRDELKNVLGSDCGPEVSAANNLAQFYKWMAIKLAPRIYGEHLEINTNPKTHDERTSLRDKILASLDTAAEGEPDRKPKRGRTAAAPVGDEA